MAEQLFKKKSPIEERKYQEAVGLQESVSYIVRFERKVNILRNAAQKFEKLGDYKDAAQRAVECRNAAEEADITGSREIFELALRKERDARTKSDLLDAVTEYKRVWKKADYEERAKEHITACKKRIVKLEKKAVWKKRAILLAVLAVCIFGFTRTIAYPFTKGFVHQQMGNYRAAANNYKISLGMPGANGKLRACYYHLGLESLKKGKKERAFKQFVKAGNYEDASAQAAALEKEFLREANKGDKVSFGTVKWLVAAKKKDKILLLCNKLDKKMIYSNQENVVWEKTEIYDWLNTTFLTRTFSEEEKADIISPDSITSGSEANQSGFVFLLSNREYEECEKSIPVLSKNWWLRMEEGLSARVAEYVNSEGKVSRTYVDNTTCHIRPAIWVRIKQ